MKNKHINELEKNIKSKNLNLKDIESLKNIFKQDKKIFIDLINYFLINIEINDNIEYIINFINELYQEINEITPFIKKNIERLFLILYQKKYYSNISNFSDIFIKSGNEKILISLKEFLKNKNEIKFINSVELYKIKKIIFELEKITNKKQDIAIDLKLDIKNEDLRWKDEI